MDAADALRAWRGELSFAKASRHLDCDPTYVRLLELRLRRPGRATAFRIQAVIGIDPQSWDDVVVQHPTGVGAKRTGVKAKKGSLSRKPARKGKSRNGAAR